MRRVFGSYLIGDCDKFHLTGVNTFTPRYELYRDNVKMHLFASYSHNRSIWTRGSLVFPVQTWTIANLIWKRHYLVIDAFTSSFSKTSFSIVFLWTMAQTPLGNCRFRPFFIHTWNVTSPSSKIVRTIWKSRLSLSSFFMCGQKVSVASTLVVAIVVHVSKSYYIDEGKKLKLFHLDADLPWQ